MANTSVQHTPGPWRIDDEHGHLVIRNGGLIADIGPFNSQANAHLIAASPTMLAALKLANEDCCLECAQRWALTAQEAIEAAQPFRTGDAGR